MKRKMMLIAGGVLAVIAGCGTTGSELAEQQKIERPQWGDEVIVREPTTREVSIGKEAVDGQSATTRAGVLSPVMPVMEEAAVMGTWDYTTPRSVSRISRSTNEYEQASLYVGKPGGTDQPFLVITTGEGVKSLVEGAEEEYGVEGTRVYLLNGQECKETTGHTKTKQVFCELLVSHGGKVRLHAMAVAKNEEQRKLALEIMASIKWTAK